MNGADTTRLESFRQLRKDIRGSNEHLIVGIDVAKDNHHAFLGTATGKTLLKRLVFLNNLQGYEKLFTYVEAAKVKNNLDKVVFGLEPTGNYHKPLGEHLIKCGFDVVLVAGTAVKKNRELLDGRWDKHDTKDAANVADLVSQGKCLFYEYPIMPLRELRNLLSFKRRLKKQEHGNRVRIRNHLLAQYFPELDPYFSRMAGCSLGVVRWCLEPSLIAGLEYEEFLRLVAPGKRTIGQREHVKLIWEKAFESIGCDAGGAVQFEAKMMVEGLQHVRESISEVEEKIEEICFNFPEYRYLLTIPGFGKDISSKVLGAIGNPFRFDNAKQVVKLSGWDLNASRSGKNSKGATAVISKKGKADLRYALYQAALVASSRNQYFVAYFTEKLRQRSRERGIKTKMRVKLAAKLLVIAWTLMKKQEPFNPEYLKFRSVHNSVSSS
ncbi:MAG: IS110 family transposase [Deltaproteobacteria bacterium]|nr:IS110 family transposase [Deltaproteobacteria bacterium]